MQRGRGRSISRLPVRLTVTWIAVLFFWLASAIASAATNSTYSRIEQAGDKIGSVVPRILASQARLSDGTSQGQQRAYERLEFVVGILQALDGSCASSLIVLGISELVQAPQLRPRARRFVALQLKQTMGLARQLRESVDRSLNGMDSETVRLMLDARGIAVDLEQALKDQSDARDTPQGVGDGR